MNQRGFVAGPIVYLIAGIAFLGMLYGIFYWVDTHWETKAGVRKGEANTQAKWDAAVAEQKVVEQKQAEKAETKLEAQREKTRTVTRTITQKVDRYIDRPVYRNVCLDADGLRDANCAISGKDASSCKPDPSVPAAKPAG